MDDLNWLADLVSDCYAFGEKHNNELIMFTANEVVDAIERDFGLRFKLLPRTSAPNETRVSELNDLPANVIRLPLRPRQAKGQQRLQNGTFSD